MSYLDAVRYPDGGGLTAEGRARREAVRLQAAALFADGTPVAQIAQRLRASQNAVYVWRRAWLAEGEAGLASKGPSGNDCKLTPAQVDKLAGLLQEGPAAHGWVEDQRWTLARVTDLIASRFRVRYTLNGVSMVARRDWLHVVQLPAYSPDLNPTEAVWSHVKRSLRNLATTGVDHLAAIVRNRLKRIQYRPDLLASFLAHTGLTLAHEPE